jgi:hypothetical protein
LIPTQSRIELKGVGKNSILSDHYGIFSELAFKNLVVKDYTSPSLIG